MQACVAAAGSIGPSPPDPLLPKLAWGEGEMRFALLDSSRQSGQWPLAAEVGVAETLEVMAHAVR